MIKILKSFLRSVYEKLLESRYRTHVYEELKDEYELLTEENIEAMKIIKNRWIDIYGS